MVSFRLIQASDLHVSTTPDVINPYDSHGALAALRALFKGPIGGNKALLLSSFSPDMAGAFSCEVSDAADDIDAVVVTGDLATTGSRADLNAALNYFEGRIPTEWSPSGTSFSRLTGIEGLPIMVMPGNHDRYTTPIFWPRSPEFENLFGPYWNFSGAAPARFADHRSVRTTYLQKDEAILALCAVDFSLHDLTEADQVPFAYMGQGRVMARSHSNEAKQPLDELVEQTQWIKASLPNAAIIWCVHYPPGFPQGDPNLRLINEYLLLARASELNIELLLSGHTHEFSSYMLGGTRVVCCGTTTAAGSTHGNAYLEITVDTANLAHPQIVQKQWSQKSGQFN